MTYNTGNPIGSTDARDRSDNSENLDLAVNSLGATFQDRLGVTRSTYEGVVQGLSFFNVGTFAVGFTLTNSRQTLTYDGHEYGWSGVFPKVVSAGSTPTPLGSGGWIDRSDVTLRNELASSAGSSLVGFEQAGAGSVLRTAEDKMRERVTPQDKGAVGDGVADDTAAIVAAEAMGALVDGLGKTYLVTTLPDVTNFRNAAFKMGSILHVTADYLRQDTAKITNAKCYLSHPQDKAYVLNNQIKVWLSIQDSHTDGDVRPCAIVSDDGGVSWQEPELLDATLFGHSCWSAGTDGAKEYVIVRKDVGPLYYLYSRDIPSGSHGDYYAAWTVTPITFPMPGWATGTQPVMIHSFTVGHDGAVYVGGSLPEGALIYRSGDGGITWTIVQTLMQSPDAEEPTVKYENGVYAGFMRNGGTGQPWFWVSRNNLATITLYQAPAGYFGAAALSDSTIPLQLVGGVVYAVTAYRNGTLEGAGSDAPTSAFHIQADLASGDNIWSHAKTYRMGTLYHAELGGASGLGQGSVVHYNDKIFLFYGNEERTGTWQAGLNTVNALNRIVNIYQTVMFLKPKAGVIDYRANMVADRSANNPFYRINGNRWLGKQGKWTYSLSEKIGSAYATAMANVQYNSIVFDLLSGSGGMTFSTDGGTFCGYFIAGPLGITGSRADTSSGTWHVIVNGAEAFRWDASSQSLRPSTDNTRACGGVTRRWSEFWAGNGTIQTSDENHKEQIQDIDVRVLRAWGRVKFQQYKMKDAVVAKGDEARWHFGVIAQRIKEAFELEMLDPFAYGLLCYNEWPETQEKICEETGAVLEPYQAAGFRYSVRYDEALSLECAYLRARLDGVI